MTGTDTNKTQFMLSVAKDGYRLSRHIRADMAPIPVSRISRAGRMFFLNVDLMVYFFSKKYHFVVGA
jgi:hypothetical protein